MKPQQLFNVVKVYPRYIKLIKYHDFKAKNLTYHKHKGSPKTTKKNELNIIRSVRRTKMIISDLVQCNEFELFCTFTFDKKKIDRYDIIQVKSAMSKWLENTKRTNPELKYLIVPEFHKDRQAIHFHALLSGLSESLLIPTNKFHNNRSIYHLKSYSYGYNSAIKIDNIDKVSSYVKKYITKDLISETGKKRFWCSQGLSRPKIYNNLELTLCDINSIYENEKFTIYIINDTLGTLNLRG